MKKIAFSIEQMLKLKSLGKEFKYHNSDVEEWHDYQPSSGCDYGTDYVNCPHCKGYNELTSW